MARAGFGGGGDYGSFFGSLYSAGKDTARAAQDAEDSDAFDKWQSGLMSDDEWTQYMTGRVNAYAGDPKRQQRWVEYLRKYSQVISDNQAEYAYKGGTSSINELIAHYQERVAAMDGDSAEARDMKLRINDLIDQRSVDSIQEGAQKISDEINKGTKSYKDLLDFLNAKLPETRANSDLRESLTKQITSVREEIRSAKVEGAFEKLQYDYDRGALGAGAYANRLRSMAQQFKESDPKRYYQILQAAVALGKAGGSGGGGGGGGGSSRGGGGGKLTPYQQKLKNVDTAMAERNRITALVEQYENGSKVGVDPATGAQVVFSPAKVRELDRQLMASFDGLATAYKAKGDMSAATGVETAKARYISSNIVKHNTYSAAEAQGELMRTTQSRITAALDDPDPTRAMNTLRGVARDWDRFTTGLEKNVAPARGYKPTLKSDPRLRAEGATDQSGVTGPKDALDKVDPEFQSSSRALTNALNVLTKPGVTDAEAEAAVSGISQLYGGSDAGASMDRLLKPVLQVAANEQGLATGEVQRVVTPKGIQYVRTYEVTSNALVNGSVVPTKTRVPDLEVDGKTQRTVDVFIDINGQPTKVTAVATKGEVGGMNSWFASKPIKLENGTVIPAGWVTQEQTAKIGEQAFDQLRAAGKVALKPAVSFWKVDLPGGTDAGGRSRPTSTWVQDEQTGTWYKDKLPIRGAQYDAYGAVKVTGDRGLAVDYGSFATAKGVPAPYAGTSPEKMQLLMDDGLVDTKDIMGRDVLGNVTPEANLKSPYWDGKPSALSGSDPALRDSWWNDDERESRAAAARADYASAMSRIKVTRGTPGQAEVAAPTATELVASSMGINLSGAKSSSRSGWTPGGAKKAVPSPKIAETTGFNLGKDAPKTFSGPTVSAATGFSLGLPSTKPGDFSVKVKDERKPADKKPGKAPVVKAKPVSKKVQKINTEQGKSSVAVRIGGASVAS